MNLMNKINKVSLHQMVLFGVMILLTLRTLIVTGFTLRIGLLWWLLGMVVGFVFVFTDRFVYSLVMKPNESLSLRIKEFFGKRQFVEGVSVLIEEKAEQKELVMRSFLFLMVWGVLGFFSMTSIANEFSRGFILGIGTHLVFDFVYDYFYDRSRFDTWFWQIKRELNHEEKRNVLMLVCLIYIILAVRF